MRARLVCGVVLVLLLGAGLAAAPETAAGPPWDLNENGLPDVCRAGEFTITFLGVQPSPTPGRSRYLYRLTADSAKARSSLSGLVAVFSRGVLPGNIIGVGGDVSTITIRPFGAGDATGHVAGADLNAFTGTIPAAGTSVTLSFFIEATVSRVGLMSFALTGPFAPLACRSFTEDLVAGPKGIEGPAVAETPISQDSAIAGSTIYTSPSNVCPIEIVRNGAGNIAMVRYTAEALENGCNPAFIVEVPQTDLQIEFNGFKLPLHHTGDGFEGNAPVLLGSTDRCLRVYNKATGTYILVSTITTRNGCTS